MFGLTKLISALKVALKLAPNAARAVSETAVGAASAPLVQVWSLTHGMGGQILMNGTGQVIQLPGAAASSASAASITLPSPTLPSPIASGPVPGGTDPATGLVIPSGDISASGLSLPQRSRGLLR